MGLLQQIASPILWGLGACLIILYPIGLAIYRLYFSPVADFPGPKLAALTFWYQFYYDVIKQGRYTWQIAKLHDTYGKIFLLLMLTLTLLRAHHQNQSFRASHTGLRILRHRLRWLQRETRQMGVVR